MSRRVLIEACVGSADEAMEAVRAGADRIELNRCLEQGGLTPDLTEVRQAVAVAEVPLFAMIRPHDNGFVYTTPEYEGMRRDLQRLLEAGVDGIVAGLLRDGRVDQQRTAALVAECGGQPLVFHRAFDRVKDPFQAMEQLIDVGVARILTSGQRTTAIEGADVLAELIERANGRIEILPGAGVGPSNACELLRCTGCNQLHGSFRGGTSSFDSTLLRATRSALSALDADTA